MSPDETVRGGEHCVPCPTWNFTCRNTFPKFSGDSIHKGLTLSYSKINAVLCPQRVSLPLKEITRYMFSEGKAAYPVGCDSLLQIKMVILRIFLNLNSLTILTVWRTSNLKESVPNGHYYLQQAVTPDTWHFWGLISRPILDLGLFQAIVPQATGRTLYWIQV